MKYAFCNEMCGDQPFPDAFAMMRSLGYTGVEFAPFTLAPPTETFDVRDVSAAKRAEAEKLAKQKLPEEALEKLLLRATGGLSFFNTSRMDLGTLGESGIKANLLSYVSAFSKDAREIFERLRDRTLHARALATERLERVRPERFPSERGRDGEAALRVADLVERRAVGALHELRRRAERDETLTELPESRHRGVLHAR